MNDTQDKAALITRQIMSELFASSRSAPQASQDTMFAETTSAETMSKETMSVPIGISNRHVHLSREDMDVLFGVGSSLTRFKAVKQPGQYAAEETVTLKGPKGDLSRVRVLGPLRNETQVEISVTDGFSLGIKPPIKMSGDLEASAGVEIIGPLGAVKKEAGAIVAWRHIHISPEDADRFHLVDGMEIDMETQGNRAGILRHVVVRVSSDAVMEMHIDVEEANALGLRNGDAVSRFIVG